MKNLTMILMLAVAFVLSASAAKAQTTPVDVRIVSNNYTPILNLGSQETYYVVLVYVEKNREATGVTVTAQLPDGVTPSSVQTELNGSCAVENNLITCNYAKLGSLQGKAFDYQAIIIIKARPITAGEFNVFASVTANEPDQDLSNNSTLLTTLVNQTKTRKRVKVF